jgi:hypothetical protein
MDMAAIEIAGPRTASLVGFTQAAPGVVALRVGTVAPGLVGEVVPGSVVVPVLGTVVVPGNVVVVFPGKVFPGKVFPGNEAPGKVVPGKVVVVVVDGVVAPVLEAGPVGPQSAPVERFTPPR